MDYYDGVKFYSKNDLSVGYYLKKAEVILEKIEILSEECNVNQIIELYNIKRFFEEDLYLDIWSPQQIEEYKDSVKKISKIIGKFFSVITESNFWDIYSEVDISYIDDFWMIFNNLKIFNKISGEVFKKILTHDKVRISDILSCQKIVDHYDCELTEYLIRSSSSAELLLRQYAETKGFSESKYYFPVLLDESKKVEIINIYIESDIANPNYLKLIYETLSTADLPLTDKMKLKAKRNYIKKVQDMSRESVNFTYGIGVSFREEQEDIVRFEKNNNDFCVIYSKEWIRQNRDYPTILNNFIYLFEYTDLQCRMQHVSRTSQLGIFERVLGVKGKKEYLIGAVFNQLQALSMLQLIAYEKELKDVKIRIEDVIEWFFKDYLKYEFTVENFYIRLPSEESSYLEKCRTILSEIDSVLKQYKLFIEDGEIDHELLQISSGHIFFKDIPSLIKDKYIYGVGEEYNAVSFHLFSDQSTLKYLEKYDKYDNLPQLLINENLEKEEFLEHQVQKLDWLLEREYLYINDDGYLKPEPMKVGIIKQLYDKDVVCYNYIQMFNDQINELVKRNVIVLESSLFSKPEQDYFNYLLNKSEFSNGLDLRNRYVHGTQSNDEEKHQNDYYIFLKILILIVIKINDEFCMLAETEE